MSCARTLARAPGGKKRHRVPAAHIRTPSPSGRGAFHRRHIVRILGGERWTSEGAWSSVEDRLEGGRAGGIHPRVSSETSAFNRVCARARAMTINAAKTPPRMHARARASPDETFHFHLERKKTEEPKRAARPLAVCLVRSGRAEEDARSRALQRYTRSRARARGVPTGYAEESILAAPLAEN